jgi:hypothetical protein
MVCGTHAQVELRAHNEPRRSQGHQQQRRAGQMKKYLVKMEPVYVYADNRAHALTMFEDMMDDAVSQGDLFDHFDLEHVETIDEEV